MAIRKREGRKGVTWQIDYLDPTGKRVRQSFKKKGDAVAELGKRVSLIGEKRYLDVKKDYTTTFGELVEKYTENFKHQKAWITSKGCYIQRLKDYFGGDTRLANITYLDVETYQNKLRTKLTGRMDGIRKPSSINREMTCLGSMFNKAVEWGMVEQSPFAKGKSLILKENNMRKRYLTEEEAATLLSECASHLRKVVFTVLNTGMRRKEVLGLKWDQIRGGIIYLTDTKMSEPREIPINDDLAAMLKEIRKEQQLTSPYVFTYDGRKIKTITTAFRAACRRAGIRDFRFHDLRHTFASHLVMKGASLKEVQELLGHTTMTMTLRYAHLAQEQKKTAVNLLNGFGTLCQNRHVTNMSQIENSPSNPPFSLVKN